ncbi:T-cell surface glycoprotein CD3 zeta chain T-cell receptor T3 zeta chain Precursor [Channa argus]|nr:T-cell surface glycoprotein CD3 zeta chain T-cell receptor T3 zeta chain Precursor [Channa argus]
MELWTWVPGLLVLASVFSPAGHAVPSNLRQSYTLFVCSVWPAIENRTTNGERAVLTARMRHVSRVDEDAVKHELCSLTPTEAMAMYEPQLCYLLDGFLGLYGIIITGMFIREKELRGQDSGGYAPLTRRDPEIGGRGLKKHAGDEYKELPVKREDLSAATRDTYQPLQMQTLNAR